MAETPPPHACAPVKSVNDTTSTTGDKAAPPKSYPPRTGADHAQPSTPTDVGTEGHTSSAPTDGRCPTASQLASPTDRAAEDDAQTALPVLPSHTRPSTAMRNGGVLTDADTSAAGSPVGPSAFKKIAVRSARPTKGPQATASSSAAAAAAMRAERSARTANALRAMAGRTGPVTSDNTIQELAATYTQRRQFMDRASQIASEMSAKARDIAAIDEQNRQMGFRGDVAHLQATIEDQLAQAERHKSKQQAQAASQTEDGAADDPTRFDLSGDTEDAVDAKAKEKLAKVLKLRTMQRRLAELDDEVVEEEQRFLLAAKRRQESQQRGGYESRRGSVVSSVHSAAASPLQLRNNAETANGATRARSASRMMAPQTSRDTASDVRQQLDALLDGDVRGNAALPDPPRHFTANALAVTLEILSQCLVRLVDATDSVCVSATFRGTDEAVDVFYDLDKCQTNYRHALLCLGVALGHVTHFEVGEKAMLEGGQFEVNSLREQFLIRKEMLTAQEQKESAAEESCKVLRLRLRKIRERFAMWEEVILGHGPSPYLQDAAPSMGESRAHDSLRPASQSADPESARNASGSPQRTGSRYADRLHSVVSSRGLGSQGRRLVNSRGRPSCSPIRLTTLGDFLDGEKVADTSAAVTGANSHAKPLSALYAQGDVPLPAEDAMELRVARTWGNPYVTKALQYQQATHLMPLYQHQLAQQQQQDQQQRPSRQVGGSLSAPRASEWAFQGGSRVESSSLTPPSLTAAPAAPPISEWPAKIDHTSPTVVILPAVDTADAGAYPDTSGALSINTTTTTNSSDGHSTSANHADRNSALRPSLTATSRHGVDVGAGRLAGGSSVAHVGAVTPGGMSFNPLSDSSAPSYSISQKLSRNDTLGGVSFVSQQIAEERLLALLQALLRVIPTESSYVAQFQGTPSDDDEDNNGGSPSARDPSARTAHSSAAASPNKAARSRHQGPLRGGRQRPLPRLVAHAVELSTEEKAELSKCQATRASVDRLLQVLATRTKKQ